jgi:hypothetical protein
MKKITTTITKFDISEQKITGWGGNEVWVPVPYAWGWSMACNTTMENMKLLFGTPYLPLNTSVVVPPPPLAKMPK